VAQPPSAVSWGYRIYNEGACARIATKDTGEGACATLTFLGIEPSHQRKSRGSH
jgi:hypothetical protein